MPRKLFGQPGGPVSRPGDSESVRKAWVTRRREAAAKEQADLVAQKLANELLLPVRQRLEKNPAVLSMVADMGIVSLASVIEFADGVVNDQAKTFEERIAAGRLIASVVVGLARKVTEVRLPEVVMPGGKQGVDPDRVLTAADIRIRLTQIGLAFASAAAKGEEPNLLGAEKSNGNGSGEPAA